MFKDRHDAGVKLGKKLAGYRRADAVVLALPRGGVVTGHELAEALALPLDIIAVRKIGHPGNPEYALGAVDESGLTLMNDAEAADVDPAWIAEETKRQEKEAKRRGHAYRVGRKPLPLRGKTAIITDDGIATGLTMRLAVRTAKAQKPAKIVVAVPVAPPESLRELELEGVAEIVVLEPPEEFTGAVGAHYREFEQVEDAEVIRLLALHAPRPAKLPRLLRMLARALGVLAILYLSVFALDVFQPGRPVLETLAALGMHLLPSAVLALILALAWRYELAGGILFIAVSFAPYFFLSNPFFMNLLLGAPFTLAGALFLASAYYRSKQ